MTPAQMTNKLMPQQLSRTEPIAAISCVLVGLVQIIAAHHHVMLWVTLSVLSCVGLWGLLRLLFVPSFVTAWSVYGVSIALSYGAGALNTLLSGYIDGAIGMLTLSYATPVGLGLAAGAASLITGSLLFASHLDQNKIIPLEPMDDANRTVVLILVLGATVGMLAALVTGTLGFQGTQFVEEGSAQVSAFASLVTASATPVVGLAALAYGRQPRSTQRWFVLCMCLILAAMQLSTGRRVFIFNTIATLIVLFAALDVRKIFTPRILVLIAVSLVALGGASRYYMAMREAGYTLPESATLLERMEVGWEMLTDAKDSGLNEKIEENQSTRTFIIGYFGELIDAYNKHQRTTGGDVLLLNLAYSTPTSIWPGKWAVISRLGSDEVACHRVMGIPAWDAANSVPTEGLCDFGWTGLLVYPLLLAGLMTLINFAVRKGPIEVRAIVGCTTIGSLLHTEGNFFGYLTNLRNVLILVAFTWVLVWLLRRFMRLPLIQFTRQRSADAKSRMATKTSANGSTPQA